MNQIQWIGVFIFFGFLFACAPNEIARISKWLSLSLAVWSTNNKKIYCNISTGFKLAMLWHKIHTIMQKQANYVWGNDTNIISAIGYNL
ncbi:MAG: hypothetical protein HAW62_06100 [Endozoicomonadaceae bacterium]|nr:hypothetical protein [Endozoicomonadaceae bacterium]